MRFLDKAFMQQTLVKANISGVRAIARITSLLSNWKPRSRDWAWQGRFATRSPVRSILHEDLCVDSYQQELARVATFCII
ncbi:MAG: hypothetical protein R3E84_04100 [Pseudomonadales bacterium]